MDHLVSATPGQWTVRRAPPTAGDAMSWPGPADVTAEWRPLGQPWRAAPEPTFNPGWARLRWRPSGLDVTTVFIGRNQTNRASRLNDRTWELGDIAELFVQAADRPRYAELHVTPENRRLQLLWPADGLADFRAGRKPFADFTVDDPAWVTSEVRVRPDHWTVRLHLPFSCLGLDAATPPTGLRACVCRYDWSHGTEVLSSTAPLGAPDYHRVAEWQPLRLVE